MHLLDEWLRRADARRTVIQVDPSVPAASAEAIQAAVRQPVASPLPTRRARAS
jgi:hypothetical protein